MANNTTGFTRIIKAAGYSWKGFRAAWINEAAFRQESVAVLLGVAIACWLDVDAITRVLLIGSVMLVMIVEILNSAIEAVVDRIGAEYHELSGRAKDMGSAAVLLSIFVALITWGHPVVVAFAIKIPQLHKTPVFCAVCGSKIAFSCIYSQHNCIYTQGAE
ncbi:diacylglycerol kinase [Citrobacter freundii]|nr:diacylglycerol kinase [Citrobacter freundii]